MAEVPEHLLRRSRERRKALGLPVEGEEADAPAAEAGEPEAEVVTPAEEAAPIAASADAGEAITESKGGIPAHLLERSRKRKAAARGWRRRCRRRGRRRNRDGNAAAREDRGRARAERHGSGRSHPATAHGRQVGFDPADARRSTGQGPRLAPPARHRVRVDPVGHRVPDDLLRAR